MEYAGRQRQCLIWHGASFGQGFLSHGSFNWLHKFLRTLDRVYHEHGQDMSIDFLFPSCKDDSIRLPIQAMQYAECLYFLRKYLRIFWHKSSSEDVTLSAQSYTVHGLKFTLLSYAAQLQLPDEMRRIQGKHRAVQASTRLYSRDDVSAAHSSPTDHPREDPWRVASIYTSGPGRAGSID